MGHKNLQNAHPKKYGKGGRGCRVCGELFGWGLGLWVWMMTAVGWGWAGVVWWGRPINRGMSVSRRVDRFGCWWANGWMADCSRPSVYLPWLSITPTNRQRARPDPQVRAQHVPPVLPGQGRRHRLHQGTWCYYYYLYVCWLTCTWAVVAGAAARCLLAGSDFSFASTRMT